MEYNDSLLLRRVSWFSLILVLVLFYLAPLFAFAQQKDDDKDEETLNGHRLSGRFHDFWITHNGKELIGLPISDVIDEVIPGDSKTHQVQYFPYAVFESHTDYSAPYDVLLSSLGQEILKYDYPHGPPHGTADLTGQYFEKTDSWLGGSYLQFWKQNFGQDVLGLPLTNEIIEQADPDGTVKSVQYFERAVLQYHRPAPFEESIELRDLGKQRWTARYGTDLEKFALEPGRSMNRLFANNPGLRIIGIPVAVGAIAVGFDFLVTKVRNRGKSNKKRLHPEPMLAFALSMPVLALSSALTAQVEQSQQETLITIDIVYDIGALMLILVCMAIARSGVSEQEELDPDQQRRGKIWAWTYFAVLVGLVSLILAAWAVSVA